MEEKTQIKTFLGSRLPKYGTKSVRSTLQPMANGATVTLLGTSKNSNVKSYIKNNGSDCSLSHSFNWRQANKYQFGSENTAERNSIQSAHDKLIDPEQHAPAPGTLDGSGIKGGLKSASLFTSKLARPSTMFLSSTEELNQKSFSGPSNLGKFTKGTLLGRTSYSSVNAKSHLNTFYRNQSPGNMQKPRVNSCATRSSSGESLAQSPDNTKSITCEKMVRSQSFSHSIQNSFLPPSSITRSHSFNRAVDLTKPYQNQQLPVRMPLRSGMLSRNSRQSEVLNGNEHLGFGFNRPYAAGGKKLTLSNGPGVSSTLGYRMVHPSLLKSGRPSYSGTMTVDSNKNSPADMCVEEEAIVLAKDGSTGKDQELVENESYQTDNDQTIKHESKIRYLSDDVDDISLSSLSSSDKNDLSEDFSDDFIDLEDSNRTRITPEEITLKEEKCENGPSKDIFDSSKENEQIFSKADEWIDISVSVECDNMNRFDRADRNVRQSQDGFWKRAPQRWSGQEHYHLSHPDHYHHHGKSDLSRGSPYRESPLGHFESYGGTPFFQAQKMFADVPDNTVILDEMTLRHMVQDCTAVKTQLLKLKRLLHQHDGSGSLNDVELSLSSSPEPEDGDQIYKNEDLLNEIKQLKEEIKKKDEKIQLLEHRLPQVLQPSSSLPRPTDHAQGKLIKPQHIEAHSEYTVQDMCQGGAHPDGSFTHGLQQENSYGLEDRPFSSSPQFPMDVVKDVPSETNLMNAQEPHHLAKNQPSDMQIVPTPPQTPSQSSTVNQTKRVRRNQSPQPKSLQHSKPSNLSSLAPPPDSDSSPSRTSTCKKAPVIAPCNSKHQPTSNHNNLSNNLNLKVSKLRPPSGSFKQKQISNPQPEPQNFQVKTSIPRPLARSKELQNPHSNLHSGDYVASNRYSRLPKPKIH
ncbi:Ccser2 [Phodopus roborovskii]|uniref:Ccser2 protein n=1 Tax=Phodopus roborovskii TaxID=109678 RepID=A0AAV0A8Z1_PHORO|nr:Ccser2 [Phodopus roborovskii]